MIQFSRCLVVSTGNLVNVRQDMKLQNIYGANVDHYDDVMQQFVDCCGNASFARLCLLLFFYRVRFVDVYGLAICCCNNMASALADGMGLLL